MAASDAQTFPVKNRLARFTAPVFDSAGSLVTSGTTAVTISKDGGTFANPSAGATNATQIATSSGVWFVDLSATDMTCDTLAIKMTNTGGVPTVLVVYPLAIAEPTAAPSFGAAGLEQVLAWLLALSRNKITQTATTSTLRNDADTTTISTSSVSDSGTTFTRDKWT
jgi:hypothetical protein